MSAWSLGALMGVPQVEKLLADVDASNANRVDFTPAIARDKALGAISAILWMYGCRSSDTSAVYASMALWESLGIDRLKSTIVTLPQPPTSDVLAGEE